MCVIIYSINLNILPKMSNRVLECDIVNVAKFHAYDFAIKDFIIKRGHCLCQILYIAFEEILKFFPQESPVKPASFVQRLSLLIELPCHLAVHSLFCHIGLYISPFASKKCLTSCIFIASLDITWKSTFFYCENCFGYYLALHIFIYI